MNFEEKYNEIKALMQSDLAKIEQDLLDFYCGNDILQKSLNNLLTAPSKRLRPLISFLYLRANNIELTQEQYCVQSAIELIHNATLIHDDVIDNSEKRRSKKTLNAEFNNSLAVISGDFLLSAALKKILLLNSCEIMNIFAKTIEKMCFGEIHQYFNKFKITTIEEYLKKSENKTASLFMASLESAALIDDTLDFEKAREFAKNFGIAFQVRDDLLNFIDNTPQKPKNNDVESGIYTAPMILSDNLNIGIEKTKELMDNYLEKAIEIIKTENKNQYSDILIRFLGLFKL